jgi:hypothetical protein
VSELLVRFIWFCPPLLAVLRWLIGGAVPPGIYCEDCPFGTWDATKLGWDGKPGCHGCAILPRKWQDDSPVLWDGCKGCGLNDEEP